MGNLYTHIEHFNKNSKRINILSELKQQWRNRPINLKKIKELQTALRQLEEKEKRRLLANRPKRLIGALERGYLRKLSEEQLLSKE